MKDIGSLGLRFQRADIALISENKNIICTEPLDYFSFQKLIKECALVITDSGGIQEESTFCKKPCLTLRSNTERPVTIEVGTNTLIPFDFNIIMFYINQIESGSYKNGLIPDKWMDFLQNVFCILFLIYELICNI